MDLGTVLDDRFELLSRMRGGALGAVWRAHDRATDATVAIRSVAAVDDARVAAAIAAVTPGVLAVLGHGAIPGGGHYLALAWLDGDTADARLHAPGVTARQAVALTAAVARALAELHDRGLAHGGVALDQIVVAADGTVTVREPAVAGAPTIAGDLHDLGRVLATLVTGRAPGTLAVRPRFEPGLPAALALMIDELLAIAPAAAAPTSAASVAARLASLDELDDANPVRAASARPGAEATADLRGASPPGPAWLANIAPSVDARVAFGHGDTQASDEPPPGPTPDLDRARLVTDALIVRPTERYQLREVVGQGGLGRVILAHDRELDRTVAIKELLRRTPSSVERFRREALVTARLQHPGIVPVHDAGRWPNGAPFYAMKLIEGDDLARLIERAPDLTARLALMPKVIAVCEAMAYAHGQRVIHRDLKPGNIVVGEFGEAMVVDWGLAKELDAAPDGGATDDAYRGDHDGHLTQAGDVLGTPAYMAPEQARGEPVDARTDVYALGAILYHLLAGRAPYAVTTTSATAPGFARRGVREVLAEPPSPLPADVLMAAPELAAIAAKAMAREAAARYPSALELARELRGFEAGQLVSAHRYSMAAMVRRWARRHRAALTVAAALMVAMIGLGTVALYRVVTAERVARRERTAALTARGRAEDARASAEAERNRLRVLQAETALARDPTEALDWLAIDQPLPPDLAARATAAATEAIARGVARARVQLPGRIVLAVGAGDRVAAVSSGGAAGVWDRDGRAVWRADLGAAGVALALADDGTQAVVASDDRQVRWWRADGTLTRALPTTAMVARLVGPDEVALATADGAVVRWRRDGTVTRLPIHAGVPTTLAVVDGDVISGAADGTLARSSPTAVRWHHAAHAGGVNDLVAAGDALITVGADGAIRRWRATDGVAQAAIEIGAPLAHVAIDGDGMIALGVAPPRRYRWAPSTGVEAIALAVGGDGLAWPAAGWHAVGDGPRVHLTRAGDVRTLDGHRDLITTMAALAGDVLVSGDRAGELRFWHLPPPRPTVPGKVTTGPAATADGWAIGHDDGEVAAVTAGGARTVLGRVAGAVALVATTRAAPVVAAASATELRVWRAGQLVVTAAITAPARLTVSPDGAYVALLGGRGQVWRTATGERLVDLDDAYEFVAVTGDRAYAATPDGVRVVGLATPADPGAVVRLPFDAALAAPCPDGTIALAGLGGRIAIVDERGVANAVVALGAPIQSLVAIGDWLYAGGVDGAVHGWRPTDDARRTLAAGHARWVHGADGAPGHDDRLVSWSRAAAAVRLWRPADGATALVPTTAPVLGAALDAAGGHVAVADRSGLLRIVPVVPAQLLHPGPGELPALVARHIQPIER